MNDGHGINSQGSSNHQGGDSLRSYFDHLVGLGMRQWGSFMTDLPEVCAGSKQMHDEILRLDGIVRMVREHPFAVLR